MNTNPFGKFGLDDMIKMWGENPFTRAIMDNDFARNFTKGARPDFDLSAVMESHRKNLEALSAINKSAGDKIGTLAKKQSELMGEAFENMKTYAADASKAGDKGVEAHLNEAREVFKKAMENFAELGEMGKDASEEVGEIISARMTESLDELQELMAKFKP